MVYLPTNNTGLVIAVGIGIILILALILTFVSASVQAKQDRGGPTKEGRIYKVLYQWGFIELMSTILILSFIAIAGIIYGYATIPGKQTSIINEAYGIEITDGWDIPMSNKIRPGIKYTQDGQEYIGAVEFEGRNYVTVLDETGVPLPLAE